MAEEEGMAITQANVDAFAAKLQSWAADLPPEEKAVLGGILARAEAIGDDGDDEVKGFVLGTIGNLNFTPSLLSNTFGNSPDGTIDSWPKGGSWIKVWAQTIPR